MPPMLPSLPVLRKNSIKCCLHPWWTCLFVPCERHPFWPKSPHSHPSLVTLSSLLSLQARPIKTRSQGNFLEPILSSNRKAQDLYPLCHALLSLQWDMLWGSTEVTPPEDTSSKCLALCGQGSLSLFHHWRAWNLQKETVKTVQKSWG